DPGYQLSPGGVETFGSPSGATTVPGLTLGGERARSNVVWVTNKVSVGSPSMESAGLGGWTISPHHFYDVNGQGTVYYGDGSSRVGNQQFPIIKVFAGNGASWSAVARPSDGNSATTGSVNPDGMATGPDGAVYVTDSGNKVVAKITRDGNYHCLAGCG